VSAAEQVAPSTMTLSWDEIRARYHDQWVGLLDMAYQPDGSVHSARVVGCSRSVHDVLDQLGSSSPDATVMHTCGRPLRTPRVEIVDESRDVVRARR
jgi:hypothetical protein